MSSRIRTVVCCAGFAVLLAVACLSGAAAAAGPELVSVAKIWDAGKHNAFTDLIRWRDKWYCTFREADDHVGGDGKLRVLESADGQKWESAALIAEEGIDLRDPKLSITPDDRLMIVAGGSVYEGKKLLGRQPRVTFSKDARTWTPPQRVLTEGEWLWRVTWHEGNAYGVSYNADERASPAAQEAAKTGKVEPGPADWKLKLFKSADGVKYDLVTHLDVPGNPNETTLRFLPDGTMLALVRREGGSKKAWIGTSAAPYTQWKWTETGHQVGGPNFIQLPDGSLWGAGRSYPGGAKTAVARMTAAGEYEPLLTLESGGDTSYPGLVWHDGMLWMSFYSSHEGKTSIYLARIKLPAAGDPQVSLPAKEKFHLYLLVGQSNMAGRGAVEEQDKSPHPRVLVFTKENAWAPAVDPLHFDKPQIAGVGLASTFGRVLAEADSEATIGLIPCAVGGTPLARWQPEGDLYAQAVERYRAAQAYGTLRGILWHQGEGDSGDETLARSYGERLSQAIAGFRKDLGAPHAPFVAGELGHFLRRTSPEGKPSFWPVVNEQISALPKQVPQTAVVSAEGLKHKGDGVHFDSASLREFGRRYAQALAEVK